MQDTPENAVYTRDDALKRTMTRRRRQNSSDSGEGNDEISAVANILDFSTMSPDDVMSIIRETVVRLEMRQNLSASGKEVPSYIREEALKRERKIERNSSASGEGKDPILFKLFLSNAGICLKKKLILKWMFALLNVGLELWQALISQEAGDGKIKGSHYRKLSLILSSICLSLSLLELLEEAKRDGVKWRRRNRGCYCLRYPGKHGRIFGYFSLWFGLLSATVQFSLNIASLVIKREVLKFDHLGLLLSAGYLLAAIVMGEHAKMVANVKCSSHGKNEAEGKLVEGLWEFECPHCPPEKMA